MNWLKNIAFVLFGLASLLLIFYGLLPRQIPIPDVSLPQLDEDFHQAVRAVNQEFAAEIQSAVLRKSPPADPWIVCRRISLGLTGTIPSLEDIHTLRKIDSQHMTAWWTERLLSDRRFADYLAERLARAYVGVEEGPFLVYRRRRFVTWLSDQLADHRPYDQLVRELISGTGIWTDSPSVNFLTVTNDVNGDEQPDEQRLAARTSRAFLGIRLDCVQCHDDNLGGDWLQQDFQQLAAFFAGARSSLLGISDSDADYQFQYLGNSEVQTVPAKVPFNERLINDSSTRRRQLAEWVTHPENQAFGRAITNRIWAILIGRPLIDPVDDLPVEGPFPPGLQALAKDFSEHGYDLRRLIRAIIHTELFQSSSVDAGIDDATEPHRWTGFPITRLRPEQVAGSLTQAASLTTVDAESHILVRLGRYEQQQDFIQRYGDTGEDEFSQQSMTIPQRLLLLNGKLVRERTKDDLINNAVTRIAALVVDDERAVDAVFWAVLTRSPDEEEREYFLSQLSDARGNPRRKRLEDLCWALFNSMEFQVNH